MQVFFENYRIFIIFIQKISVDLNKYSSIYIKFRLSLYRHMKLLNRIQFYLFYLMSNGRILSVGTVHCGLPIK